MVDQAREARMRKREAMLPDTGVQFPQSFLICMLCYQLNDFFCFEAADSSQLVDSRYISHARESAFGMVLLGPLVLGPLVLSCVGACSFSWCFVFGPLEFSLVLS